MTEPPAALRQALLPGEEIRWHGRPAVTKGMGWSILLSLLGLLPLLLVARANPNTLMTINDVPVDDPATRRAIWLLFMVVTTAIALAMPYYLLRLARTVYAITDRRVLVLTRVGLPASAHSVLPWRIWGSERPDKPSADTVGQLLILRAASGQRYAGAVERLAEFSAIRDDIGAQAAINALVARPRPLIGDHPAPSARPEPLAASLHWRLRSGERLLWAAQPDRARYALGALLPALMIALFVAPFIVAFLNGVLVDPLMLVVAACVGASPVLAWRNATRLVFAITTERVIVEDRRRDRVSEVSWPLGTIESIHRSLPPARTGSLSLWDGRRLDDENRPVILKLAAVPDLAAAEAALFAALDGMRRDAAAPTRQDTPP